MKVKKYNVVALGARDYYQVALALSEKHCLHKLITNFYTANFLRKYLKKRFNDKLDSAKTVSLQPLIWWLNLLYCLRFFKKPDHRAKDYMFGFVSALWTFLGCNRAIVYSYYLDGFLSFYRLIGKQPDALVVFQVHPTPWHINRVLNNDIKQAMHLNSENYQRELEADFDLDENARYFENLQKANLIVCASSFTAQSITSYSDIAVPIDVVPYGSKFEHFLGCATHTTPSPEKNKIRLLTVAQVIHRKGLHYAFNAMKGLENKFEWVIVANKVDPAIKALAPSNIIWKNGLSDLALAEEFTFADLFVMPSLVEGFGLVYIEALACGLPVLASKNTGAYDFVEQGVEGFIVDPGNEPQLKEIFTGLATEKISLPLSTACVKKAKSLTWVSFREQIYQSILKGQQF